MNDLPSKIPNNKAESIRHKDARVPVGNSYLHSNECRTLRDTVMVFVLFDNSDYVIINHYRGPAPDIVPTDKNNQQNSCFPMMIDNMKCTNGSKSALLEALRIWLQAKHDKREDTKEGLDEFFEQARIEYLQPIE